MVKQLIQDNKEEVDTVLAKFLMEKRETYALVDPVLGDILQLVIEQTMRGGKRLRPLFTRLGFELFKGNDQKMSPILKALVAIELIHQFLLIHDDFADRDEKRYGNLTMHKIFTQILTSKSKGNASHWGDALAVVGAGNFVHVLAYEALFESDFNQKAKSEAMAVIRQYLIQTVAGWSRQFFALNEPIEAVKEEDYLQSTKLVAAHYTVEGPLWVGTALAGNDKFNHILSEYAVGVGLAFQIQDDILGMMGDSKKTGKPVGNDFREGKKTVLILQAYKKANAKDKQFLQQKIGANISKVELERAQEIIRETGALEYSKKMARKYAIQGLAALDKLPMSKINKEALESLRALGGFLAEREY